MVAPKIAMKPKSRKRIAKGPRACNTYGKAGELPLGLVAALPPKLDSYSRRSLYGYTMAGKLKKNIVLLVRKKGHESFDSDIDRVLDHHGMKVVWSSRFAFTRGMISDVYRRVFAEKPHIREEIMRSLAARGPNDHNSVLQLVWVPKSTIQRLSEKHPSKVSGPRTAMKYIAGPTEPKKALKRQQRTGTLNIRGVAYHRARTSGGEIPLPTIINNVVHVPSGVKKTLDQVLEPHEVLTHEFYNNLANLVPDEVIPIVNRKAARFESRRKRGKVRKA